MISAPMSCLLWVIAAYLLGSIPFGLWIGLARGVDVREQGSGNIGSTNVARSVGRPWAVLVLLLDATKGYLPVWAVTRSGCAELWVGVVMFTAVCGHVFSLYLRFRGGKGVATGLGVLAAVSWPAALAGLAVYLVTLAAKRISSLGSLLGVSAAVVVLWVMAAPAAHRWAMVAIALLIFFRHRENLNRLLRGTER